MVPLMIGSTARPPVGQKTLNASLSTLTFSASHSQPLNLFSFRHESHTWCPSRCGHRHAHTHTRTLYSDYILFQEKDLKVNQEASFMVQRNGARGVVDAKVHTPSGSSEECYVTELDSGTHEPHFIVQSRLQETENFFFLICEHHL